MKPYYERGGITIYHGDCREILQTLENKSIDAVVTDPPYGTGKLETNGASYTVKPKRATYEWDTWDISWIDEIQSKCYAVFTPPEPLPEMLKRGRLLVTVCRQGVTVKNVSPVFRVQPIVLIGKTPINYMNDWCEFINDGRRKNHPTEKPINVMNWLVSLTSNEGDLVLDPFMGSGTTLLSAKSLGRRAIGIELEEQYCEIAARRLSQEVMAL